MESEAARLLKELTAAHGVPGDEGEVRAVFQRELAAMGELGTDRMGSIFCRSARNAAGPRVLVAGHMDEVGFRVQSVTQDGALKIVPVGGWWGHSLLSQRVELKTAKGEKIPGVVASKPPHFLSSADREKVLEVSEMLVDIGASSRIEAESWGVRVGDSIAPWSPWCEMRREHFFMTKAFDNRVGCAGAIQVGKEEEDYPCELITAATVQEEVGLRGARTLAYELKPQVALVLEGPPADDTPGSSKNEAQGVLGSGVQIRLHDPSAIMNPRLARFAIEMAEKHDIRHQVTVRTGGGTDAGSFSTANSGIPSVVLGTPARYIHSHNSIIDLRDQVEMVRLVKVMLANLDEDRVASFTNFLG